MQKTRRIKATEVQERRFYQLPKWLIHDQNFKGLSNDAKVLYSIMRDRHELSLANNWVDQEGCIFMIYSRKSMMEDLQLSDKTITKAVNDLKKYGLIDEVRQGNNKPNLLYVLTVDLDSQWNRKNYDSGIVKTPTQESEILRPNDTKESETNLSETDNNKKTTTTKKEKKEVVVVDPNIIDAYINYFGKKPNYATLKKINTYLEHFEADAITYAFDIAANKGKEFDYVVGILKRWQSQELFTFDAIFESIKKD